jgi:hopanoid biosynthesis associated RND transporter like protein HpnN
MQIKRLTEDSIIARLLGLLARAVLKYRWAFLYPQIVLCILCGVFTFYKLDFNTRRNDLVGANKKYHQTFLKFKKEFPTQDDLVVVVESDNPEKNRQFVERLGAKLEAETNTFRDVFYKGDLKMLGAKALLFVPEPDLLELRKTLQDYRPFLKRFTQTTNLVSLFDMINQQFRTATAEKNAENESLIKAVPALERIVKQARDSLRRPGTPPSPGVTALFSPDGEAEQAIYITFANGKIYLVTCQAPTDDDNPKAVERLRTIVAQTKSEVPGLNVGITGEPVLEHDEMEQSQKDTTVASIVSLVVCAIIFIYGYQETGRPIKATLCLIVGLSYTMGFTTATVGHLNILTITFVPILIGLAIDYGVHLISRYEEELRKGKSEEAAMTRAIVYTGQGIFTGALTTAGAFIAMAFTNFKGIQEMGIICGGGLMICLIPMMTMLPVLLLKGKQNHLDHEHGDIAASRARIENLWLQRPKTVMAVTLVICVLAGTQIVRVYFDYNLLNMQSAGLPAVEFEEKLITANNESTNSNAKSVLFGAVIATNLEQALSLEKRLTNLPAVAGVESITRFLTEDQTRKLKQVEQIKEDLADIRFKEPDAGPVNIYELSRTLYSTAGYFGNAVEATAKEEPELSKQLVSMQRSITDLRKQMLKGTPAELQVNADKLAAFQRALFEDIHDTFEQIRGQDTSGPLRIQDLPLALQHRFIGVTGKYLVMVYPKEDVWKRENQKKFIDEVNTVDPDMTGTPVQLYHYTELLKRSYEEAARYSLIAITLLVFIHFRSPLTVALALTPVGIGFLWLGGIMGWLDIPLNPANIMTLPLVIGIGVTNGIHILNRFAEEQNPSILARSTGKAVLVSGLTAMAGFGSLILAQHRGIRSLGLVMSIGLATCMVAGLTLLPAVLNLFVSGTRADKNRPSADNAQSTLGREEPR